MKREFVWTEEGYKSDPAPIQLEGDYNLDNIAAAISLWDGSSGLKEGQ